jgi:hypothetical protein
MRQHVLPVGFVASGINSPPLQRCELSCRVINYIRIVLKSVLELAVMKSLNWAVKFGEWPEATVDYAL